MTITPSYTRQCVCGCGNTFSTSRIEDIYASRACRELHAGKLRKRSARAIAARFSEIQDSPALDPREWINAATLAMRLDTHAATISKLAQEKLIPFIIREGEKRFHFPSVVRAVEEINLGKKNGRKLLTSYFSSR